MAWKLGTDGSDPPNPGTCPQHWFKLIFSWKATVLHCLKVRYYYIKGQKQFPDAGGGGGGPGWSYLFIRDPEEGLFFLLRPLKPPPPAEDSRPEITNF